MNGQLRLEDHLGTLIITVPPEPSTSPVAARPEIVRLRAAGYGHTEIARSLNNRGIPTPTGRGQWWPQTVRRHIHPEKWRYYMRDYRRRQR